MEAHRVLGVARDASEEQIRRAYKALAMKWHPDRRPQEQDVATAKFVEISKASRTLLRNLRRRRRPPTTGTTTPSDSPESSPKKPPAALPKSPTRSSSQFTTRSEPTRSFSSFSFVESEPSSPSLSTTNSDHRGHVLTHSPLAQDPSPLPTDSPSFVEDPVGSGTPASLKSARNRLKKQSRPPSSRTLSDLSSTIDFTPRLITRRNAPPQEPGIVIETLCPGRAILSAAGADTPKKWVHVLNMTLEELFHGKIFHFRILRYTRVGKKRVVPVDIHIPAGTRTGTEVLLQNLGHETKDGKYQDISFVVKEKHHPRFTRVRDDLLMEVKLPWLEHLVTEIGQVYLRSVDDMDYMFPIDYRSEHLLFGSTIIPDAGMPRRNGVGRGRIIVQWEISSPSSSGWDSIKATFGFKSRA